MSTFPSREPYPELPRDAFAFPGPLRDQLTAATCDGTKVTSSSLLIEYELNAEPLPQPGEKSVLIDSDDKPVCVVVLDAVNVVAVKNISVAHAQGEGEGYETVAEWLNGHKAFWHSAEFREAIGIPDFTVTKETMIVCESFHVTELLQ